MLFKRKQPDDSYSQNEEGLVKLLGSQSNSRVDIVFVHGLRGSLLGTWHPKQEILTLKELQQLELLQQKASLNQATLTLKELQQLELLQQKANFFPFWLSKDFPDICVWSYGYRAEPSHWTGLTMALFDRAGNLLSALKDYELGQRPLFFITHSLGGLVVKKMLQNAHATPTNVENQNLLVHTKGVVFIATPHTGSHLATMANYWFSGLGRSTITASELEAANAGLRELNEWYRFNSEKTFDIGARVFFETKPLANFLNVVDPVSANPGLSDQVEVTGIAADHIAIAKPLSPNDPVYRGIKRFLRMNLDALSLTPLPFLQPPPNKEIQEEQLMRKKQKQEQNLSERPFQAELGSSEIVQSKLSDLELGISQRQRKLDEIEERITEREDQDIKEALKWLSEDRSLAERYGTIALREFDDLYRKMQVDSSRLEDFYWELQMFFKQLRGSLATRTSVSTKGYKILSEPRIPNSIPHSDVHIYALELLKKNIPPYVPQKVRVDLEERIDYLKSKLKPIT